MKRRPMARFALLPALCAGLLLSACAKAPGGYVACTPTPEMSVMQTSGVEAQDPLFLEQAGNVARVHKERRKYPAPAVGNYLRYERGDWAYTDPPEAYEAERESALASFLSTANVLFDLRYGPKDARITFCRDNTRHRADLWRIETGDGVLAGAVEAGSLHFLSADCAVQPADALHESYAAAGDAPGLFNADVRIRRAAAALHARVSKYDSAGGAARSNAGANHGWSVTNDYLVTLTDGRVCWMTVYGDADLTLECIGVFPDAACAEEQVYWRADLEWGDTIALVSPQDFEEGAPGDSDRPAQEALAFYDRFVQAANGLQPGEYAAPALTFYVDRSGVRDNYWHIDGEYLACDLTNRGHMLNALCNAQNGGVGAALSLTQIPYERMGEDAYIDATWTLFQALFGNDAVKLVKNNAVVDGHICTMHVLMNDGTAYEMGFYDGQIRDCQFFSMTEKRWGTRPNWDADWLYKNTETGETFYQEW